MEETARKKYDPDNLFRNKQKIIEKNFENN